MYSEIFLFQETRTIRVRTVLTAKQLEIHRTSFAKNPRPDDIEKEELQILTNLSPRLIRVWFQNKRCKVKKQEILARLEKVTQTLHKQRYINH